MREILYRAKSLYSGEGWVYGQPRHYALEKRREKWTMFDPYTGIETDIAEETLGQYTGLTDKNGNKIFEGDIVRINESISKSKRMGVVIYDETKGQTCIDVGDGCKKYSFERKIIIKDGKCTIENSLTFEVIGNIHDNPELMKGDKK